MRKVVLIYIYILVSGVLIGQTEIRGLVLLEGEPAIGATVTLEGTSYGTTTEIDGSFRMPNVPQGNYLFEVSYIGAETYREHILIEGAYVEKAISLLVSTQMIENVVISAESIKRKQENRAVQIESVDMRKLSASVRDLSEAIDQLSGVRVRSSGSLGAKSDISLNGLNGSAIRTYIDGLPLEFVYPNSSLGNLPINTVKRIDVYKGVLPIDIGTDAMGGGVNILPEYKSINSFKASYGYGSYNTHNVAANGSLVVSDDITLNASGSFASSANNFSMKAYVWEEGEEQDVKRFHDGYHLALGEIGVLIRNKKWADFLRVNASYTDYYKEQQHGGIINRIAFGEVNYSGNNQNTLVDYRKTIAKQIKFRNALAYSIDRLNYVDTSTVRYSWSGKPIGNSVKGEYNGASNSQRNQYAVVNRTGLDTDLGNQWTCSISNLYARQLFNGRDRLKSKERDILVHDQVLVKNISGLALEKKLWDYRFEIAGAIKYYNFQLKAVDFKAFSPIKQVDDLYGYYATAKYRLTDDLFVRASMERAWRIPTYEQFFGNGINIIAHPDLRPESSHNVNLGANCQFSISDKIKIKAESNLFLRRQQDIIFLTTSIRSRYINAEEVSSRGIEIELDISIWEKLRVRANYTQLAKRYDAIDDANISGQFLVGTPFPNTPNSFGNVSIRYDVSHIVGENRKGSIYVEYKYIDEFNHINVGKIRNENNWIPVQHRTNIGCSYSLLEGRYTFSFAVNNVFNKTLYDNYRIPLPRRNFKSSIVYTFNQ